MAKKQKKRKGNSTNGTLAASKQTAAPSIAVRKNPEIPVFWIAVIIPVICFVGAWTHPPVATPMELKSYASQIYLSGLLLLWFWLHRKQKEISLTFSPGRISFGLLFIVGTLSLLWASNPDFWVYKWNKWYAGFAIFLLGLQIIQNEKNLDRVVSLTILGGLIVAIIGIAQYLFLFNGLPQTSFPSSTFGNGNMAGQVMVLTAFLPLYFLFKKHLSTEKIWFFSISLALLLAYTYYTRTRAVWLACGFEAFLVLLFVFFEKTRKQSWLFWNPNKTKAGISAIVLFLILINFNNEGFQPFWGIALFELSSIAEAVNTSAGEIGGERFLIWESALPMVRDNPVLGAGLGNFFDIYNTAGYADIRILGVQRVHSDVFELAIELGALGLVSLLGIIGTMCVLLYKLFLRSEGVHRILFALLTIAVTGSMMNAQLSFPYQLPVPLIIMPFFMALIIRGSEDIESNTTTITLPPLFNRVSTAICGLVFCFFLVNDLTWLRDVHVLNKIVRGDIKNEEWKPVNPIYNQVYITAGRSVYQALKVANNNQLALKVLQPVIDYWPDAPASSLMAAESYLALNQYEESEYWAKKTIENQPEGSYLGEYFLMQIFTTRSEFEKLRELYESLKTEPDELLKQNRNTYNALHSMAINLQDFENVTYFYEKFVENYGEFAPLTANQAIYYVNIGNYQEAIPHMRRALELNPNLNYRASFEQTMSQYPDY
jgi:O-antigen ligase